MTSYLIAGASRGIGAQTVKTLASNPDNIVVALVRSKATSQAINGLKGVHVVEVDLENFEAVKAAAQEVSALLPGGKLDHFIYNAVYAENALLPQSILDFESDPTALSKSLANSFHGNVATPLSVFLAFLPLIRKSSVKKVVFLSTGIADFEFTRKSQFQSSFPYTCSKSALSFAALKLSTQLSGEGFIVISLSPGYVDTSEATGKVPDAPYSEETLKFFGHMVESFKKAAPNWNGEAITPAESVDAFLKVIANLTKEDGGKLLSHKGSETEFL